MDTLTPEQRNRMAQKLSEAMSLYYTAHPEEFLVLRNRDNLEKV